MSSAFKTAKEKVRAHWLRQPVVYPLWGLLGGATAIIAFFTWRNFALHGDIIVNKKNPWKWQTQETPKLISVDHSTSRLFPEADLTAE